MLESDYEECECIECYYNARSVGFIDLTFCEWEQKLINDEIALCKECRCENLGEYVAFARA